MESALEVSNQQSLTIVDSQIRVAPVTVEQNGNGPVEVSVAQDQANVA